MKLKQSNYNYIYDDLGKDSIIMYNSRTCALAVVKEEQYQQFTNFLASEKEIADKDFLNQLMTCGYLIPYDVDEKFIIKTLIMSGRYNLNILSITIAPTMACNFRCPYCFEEGRYGQKPMTDETIENIIQFITERIDGIRHLNISWFGGEPLLAMPIIEKISKTVLTLCEEKGVYYSSGIITNGYLYTKDIAERLKELHIKYAQITMDGPKEFHDIRRPLLNGKGTYDVIMSNLMAAKDILPICLRINIDKENMDAVDKMMSDLRERDLLKSISIYLGLVLASNDSYQKDLCLSHEDYSKYNFQFWVDNQEPMQGVYPFPKTNQCIADMYNGYVIDDKGDMYKCWHDIGNTQRRIGNINNGSNFLESTEVFKQYIESDPTTDAECQSCKMLPICVGGCPHNREFGLAGCEQKRHVMHEYLVECTKAIMCGMDTDNPLSTK